MIHNLGSDRQAQLMQMLAVTMDILKEKGQFDEVHKELNARRDQMESLLKKDHDMVGKVLKTHLIIEFCISERLIHEFPHSNFVGARLSFSQKIRLLPQTDPLVELLSPAIRELNKIRNKFAHDLNAEISLADMPTIRKTVPLFVRSTHDSVDYLLTSFAASCDMIRPTTSFVREALALAQHEALERLGLGHLSNYRASV